MCCCMYVPCLLCCELAPHRLAVNLHLSGRLTGRQADRLANPFSSCHKLHALPHFSCSFHVIICMFANIQDFDVGAMC